LVGLYALFCTGKEFSIGEENTGKLIIAGLKQDVFLGVVVCLCAFFLIFLLQLVSYHTYLVFTGQTTNEHVRHVFRNAENPFDLGCMANCRSVFFDSIPESLIPKFSEIDPERNPIAHENRVNEHQPLL
jgi:hypothetical protein